MQDRVQKFEIREIENIVLRVHDAVHKMADILKQHAEISHETQNRMISVKEMQNKLYSCASPTCKILSRETMMCNILDHFSKRIAYTNQRVTSRN